MLCRRREVPPALLQKRGKATDELAATLAYLRTLVVSLDEENFAAYREDALQRLRGRDAEDWPILAAALSLGCGVWTEDQDFFGTGYGGLDDRPRRDLPQSRSKEVAIVGCYPNLGEDCRTIGETSCRGGWFSQMFQLLRSYLIST